jgi:hypothetical protein
MNRIIVFLLVMFCLLFAISCSTANMPTRNTDDTKDHETNINAVDMKKNESMINTVDVKGDEPMSNAIDEKENEFMPKTVGLEEADLIPVLEKLVEGNKKCLFELFVFGFLPFDGGVDLGGDNAVVQVCSDEFATFADLERYVRSIYCVEESNRLLFGTNGNALYLDVDGILHINGMMLGGKGYYVNMDYYEIVIRNQQLDICDFDIITTEEDISNYQITITKTILSFQALLEDNVWKLTKMVY